MSAPALSWSGWEDLSPARYSQLVDDYRNGNFRAATSLLSEVPRDSIRKASRNYRQTPATDTQFEAAALLHTEVAVETGVEEAFHLKEAREYIERIKDASRRRTFERRWLLTVAYHFQAAERPRNALPYVEDGLELFPQDLELQLAMGSASEMAGWMGSDKHLEQAEEQFRSILKTHPDHRASITPMIRTSRSRRISSSVTFTASKVRFAGPFYRTARR
jgi:tetratricopeptide (TPR) repeat protein